MTTTRTAPAATTYRPGQPIEAQFGPSGWTPATYAAFRQGQHLIRTEDGDVLPAHPDKIRAVPAAGDQPAGHVWTQSSPSIWEARNPAGIALLEVNAATPGIFTPRVSSYATGGYGLVGRNVTTLAEAQQLAEDMLAEHRGDTAGQAQRGFRALQRGIADYYGR